MSRLLEKLERISDGASQPIGFGAAAAKPRLPSLLLLAHLSGQSAEEAALTAQRGADALLIPGKGLENVASLSTILNATGGLPCGLWLSPADAQSLKQYQEMGLDFLVFEAEGSTAAILQEETLGKVLEINPSLDDSLWDALEPLAIDAVLLKGEEEPYLSVHHLMVYQHLATLAGKPLITPLPLAVTEADLRSLRDVGVAGVLVNITDSQSLERLSALRQAIDSLPSAAKRKRGRVEVVLPLQKESLIPSTSEEEE